MKSKRIAYLLWTASICGWLGLHRFYLKKNITGILWIVSGGFLGIGLIYDLISLGQQVEDYNQMVLLTKMAFTPIPDSAAPPVGKVFETVDHAQPEFTGPLPLHRPDHLAAGTIPDLELISKPICPHCWTVLPQVLSRRGKCPSCREEIYVRKRQTLFASAMLKKEDALAVDALESLERFGIRESDFIREEIELSRLWEEEITSSDVIWSLWQQVTAAVQEDPKLAQSVQQQMETFLQAVDEPLVLRQRAARLKLLKFKEIGVQRVRIVAASKACPVCRLLQDQSFGIDEALKKMPLPVKKCTQKGGDVAEGFCRCDYQPLFS